MTVWYCADCGSPDVYDIQPTTDEQGRYAFGFCGIAGDCNRHGCSYRDGKFTLVPLVTFQNSRKARTRREGPETVEAFPGADFSAVLL